MGTALARGQPHSYTSPLPSQCLGGGTDKNIVSVWPENIDLDLLRCTNADVRPFCTCLLPAPTIVFQRVASPKIVVTIGYRQFHSANDVIITHLQPAGTVVHFCFSTVRAGVGAICK